MIDKMTSPSTEMGDSVGASIDTIENTLAEFLDTASVTRVYGEPVQSGQTTILPAAEVLVAFGFGVGFGGSQNKNEAAGGNDGGGGGGGAGRTLTRPVAIIITSPEGVRVEPVVDLTKIALAGITAAGFMLATLLGIVGPRSALRQLKGK